MAIIQIRVDEQLKENANRVFKKCGLDLSTAIRIFLNKCVQEQTIPFSFSEKKDYEELERLVLFIQKHQKEIGNDKMTLDEINEEISLARKERRKKTGG